MKRKYIKKNKKLRYIEKQSSVEFNLRTYSFVPQNLLFCPNIKSILFVCILPPTHKQRRNLALVEFTLLGLTSVCQGQGCQSSFPAENFLLTVCLVTETDVCSALSNIQSNSPSDRILPGLIGWSLLPAAYNIFSLFISVASKEFPHVENYNT